MLSRFHGWLFHLTFLRCAASVGSLFQFWRRAQFAAEVEPLCLEEIISLSGNESENCTICRALAGNLIAELSLIPNVLSPSR
jgi:hypothetical protein